MHNAELLEEKLREIVERGRFLDAAILELRREGIGTLFIAKAVAAVANLDRKAAQKVVVRATAENGSGRS